MNPILIEHRAQRRVIGPPETPIITDRRREWQRRREACARGACPPAPIRRA